MLMKEMVQKAIEAGHSKPADGVKFVKDNFGLDMKTTQFTQAKMALLGKRGSKNKGKKKSAEDDLERVEEAEEAQRRKDRARKARERYAAKKDTRRMAAGIADKLNPVAIKIKSDGGVEINYCPKCGCNVKAVRNALSIARIAEGVSRG